MAVEIRVPEAYMGEVNRDLNGRRGRVLGHGHRTAMQIISAHVPAGRAVHLRDRAALADPRSRHVHARRSTTTRTCPPTSPRRSSRRTARSSRPTGTEPRAPRLDRTVARRAARSASGGASSRLGATLRPATAGSARASPTVERVATQGAAEVEPALVERAADDRAGAAASRRTAIEVVRSMRRCPARRDDRGRPRRARTSQALVEVAGPGRRGGRRGRSRSPRTSSTPAADERADRVLGVDAGRAAGPAVADGQAVADVDGDGDPVRAVRRDEAPGERRVARGPPSRRRRARRPAPSDGRDGRVVRSPPATSTRDPVPHRRDDRRDRRRRAPARPVRAPSRSTTCSQRAPGVGERRARPRPGRRENAVSRAKSPCSSRTTRPPRRSIAGRSVEGACHRHVIMLAF